MSHVELPIRFAQRIRQIEELPEWTELPELVEVHGLYSESFRELRLVDVTGDLGPFTEVIQSLKARMRRVIPLLATGMRRVQTREDFTEGMVNTWLDTFLLSRIGTEMLTSQYAACVAAQEAKIKKTRNPSAKFVDMSCDPAAICEQAAAHVRRLCAHHYQLPESQTVRVKIETPCKQGRGRVRFPYMPQYLFYILVELLKNSARATMEMAEDQAELQRRPIVITVGADSSQVCIRLSDVAGGIPFALTDRVWSYMYSTARDSDSARGKNFSQQGTPLAGYGVGLPLSRLYARYMGGSLHVMSMAGIGTNAYLHLKRLETEAREMLPVNSVWEGDYGSLGTGSSSI